MLVSLSGREGCVGTIQFLGDVQLVAYTGLAVVAFVQWRQRRSQPAAWVVATFGSLAMVLLIARFLPKNGPDHTLGLWSAKILLAVVILFPYFLYRFMTSLKAPPTWLTRVAPTLTALMVAGSLALPYLPKQGAPRPGWFELYVLGLVAQWSLLSVTVAVGLWKAGKGEPTIARRRMRVLGSGAAGLALIIVISGSSPGGRQIALTIGIRLLALGSASLFYLGFVPPTILRQLWRRREDEALRGALAQLMTARTVEEVAKTLIPTIPGLVGGQAAALIDNRGRLLGSFGLSAELGRDLDVAVKPASGLPEGELRPGLFALSLTSGSLLVWAGPFTPYFGDDDIDFLRYIADLADLALERCEVFARERSFIGNASHELRTPLTTIAGMAGILAETWKDMTADMIEECLDAMNRQGDRVRDLIQNLLDLSRIDNTGSAPALKLVSLAAAGRSALEVAPPPDGRTVHIDIRDSVTAVADPMGLERALTNLLVNAYRYGGPQVRVAAEAVDREVVISVSDNGEGVPAELVPRLFDPFTRGTDTGGITGSGLGLAITQRLVENFGGRVAYEPGTPRGAKFTLHLKASAA